MICTGYAQGIALVIEVLARSGARRLAVEDPSRGRRRRARRARGRARGRRRAGRRGRHPRRRARPPRRRRPGAHPVAPVADRRRSCRPAPRSAALRWAHERGALIIEDDYDAEYRYDRAPIGAMQGLAPDRVVYAGTASKTLAPGLRLGWLVAPPHLVERVAAAEDAGRPRLARARPARLRRLPGPRRVRPPRAADAPVYRRRRDALLAALRAQLPELEPAGIAAGLHLVAYLPRRPRRGGGGEAAAGAASRSRPGALPDLRDGRPGLIFGYAALGEATIWRGVSLLSDALQARAA